MALTQALRCILALLNTVQTDSLLVFDFEVRDLLGEAVLRSHVGLRLIKGILGEEQVGLPILRIEDGATGQLRDLVAQQSGGCASD